MKKTIKYIFPIAILALLLHACKKDDVIPDFEPTRLFTPGVVNITGGETQVVLQWSSSLYTEGKGVKYTVEVSTDSLFGGTPVLTEVVDTARLTLTDDHIEIKKKYFARIKANSVGASSDSRWVTSGSFMITGEQIFLPLNETRIKDKSVILSWRNTPGLTRLVLKPENGTATTVNLTAADITAAEKQVTNLQPSTTYTAEIYAGNKLKGFLTFKTKEPSIFTIVITPADDLLTTVANAADNEVIGLEPGEYNAFASNIIAQEKHITIQSVSGNPRNTKVNFKEIVLKGNNAGVKLSGIEFDGALGNAAYFLNFTGLNSDAEAANFESVLVENSIIHNTGNCFLRGNRGGNNAHKIDFIRVNNCIAYDNGNSTYNYFTLDKMEINNFELRNSTFYNTARAFISWATNITFGRKPNFLIEQCTINNFGFQGRNNVLFDANANPVDFTMRNSILANIPKPGETVGTSLLRASGGGLITFEHNNYFKLTTGATPAVELSFPTYVVMSSNKTIDLGWTAATTNFSLPTNTELRTAGKNGGPIGDPRWF